MPIGDHLEERFIRFLPGRIRIQVFGLRHNPLLRQMIVHQFSACKGIVHIDPSMDTGRMLIVYEPKRITFEEMYPLICSIEKKYHSAQANDKEVAATAETMGFKLPNPGKQQIPYGLTLSLGGLLVLGVKRLITGGTSTLARSPTPFYLSSLVAIVTGYPFFTKRIEKNSYQKKQELNLILASSIILALIRENLVVLAGISLLQYLTWRRNQATEQQPEQIPVNHLCPEIQQYSQKVEKWGMALAAASWVITGNPLTGLAVLLAANPRPATLPAEYAWTQAEMIARERGYVIPERGSILQLARTETVLFADTSMIFSKEELSEIRCMTDQEDEEKIWCLAASLLKKTDHPWKEELLKKAEQTGRTLRTSFHVKPGNHGVKGVINGLQVFIGNKEFMQQEGVDYSEYQKEIQKLEDAGYMICYVAKQEYTKKSCMGLLMKERVHITPGFATIRQKMSTYGWKMAVLENHAQIDAEILKRVGIDSTWLAYREEQIEGRRGILRKRGKDILFIGRDDLPDPSGYISSNIPSLAWNKMGNLDLPVAFGKRMDRTVNQHVRITKIWNVAGSVLAVPFGVDTMMINTIADVVLLIFLSRSKWVSESC